MNEYMNKYGDTFLVKDQLIDYTKKYLDNNEFQIDVSLVTHQLDSLINANKIIQKMIY